MVSSETLKATLAELDQKIQQQAAAQTAYAKASKTAEDRLKKLEAAQNGFVRTPVLNALKAESDKADKEAEKLRSELAEVSAARSQLALDVGSMKSQIERQERKIAELDREVNKAMAKAESLEREKNEVISCEPQCVTRYRRGILQVPCR
jgi:predicted  nucleic acid-binding Zn-ribbon protein